MRALRVLALGLALSSAGCSLLFPPSSYTDGRDSGAGVDASSDADVGDGSVTPDVGPRDDADVDGGPIDAAPSDASVGVPDHWPSCPSMAVDARDVTGATAQPSTELASELGSSAFGVLSDVSLPGISGELSMVEIATSDSGDLFVVVALDGPGEPLVRSVARDATFSSTSVDVNGFPLGATVLDMSTVRFLGPPTLVVLVALASGGRAFERCVLTDTTCDFTQIDADTRTRPEAVALADIGTVPIYQVGTDLGGEGAYALHVGSGTPYAASAGELIAQRDSRAGSTGGAVAWLGVDPSGGDPWRAIYRNTDGSVGALALLSASAGAILRMGDTDYLFASALDVSGGFTLDVRAFDCSESSCTCPCSRAGELVADARAVVMDGDYDPSTSLGFVAVGTAYDDPGTDVRLYPIVDTHYAPATPERAYITLGSGRVGSTPGTLSSMAMAAYFGSESVDVFEAAIATVAGAESVYLSGVRYCRTP